ncbi:hypothetical protein Acr_18g0008990 [Actinidia rufa]|uniref:RNase H type-1 domain-containing protein n=1 Tax=Actinidia rufa TaxID=165716 RepID=A0A7J0G7H8_9ERIC|nr:hypothetical protein Acr_18g0008990 [Actinidia rufa]
MANTSQDLDLEGLHRGIHGMAEQMRVMNKNNARLIQLLAAANPPPLASPSIPDIERSHHSHCSGHDHSQNNRKGEEVKRGRSPRRNDQTRRWNMSTSQKIRDLDARLDTIDTGAGALVTVDAWIRNRAAVYTEGRRYGENRQTTGDIQVIHGGFEFGGCSSSSRKRHARSAHGRAKQQIYNLSSPFVDAHPLITFNNDDLRGLHLPHDDALVVLAVIAKFNVQRILVDNGSSADILFISTFDKIRIGHPTLAGTRAITSTYHLKMKFPTSTGVGEITNDENEVLRDEVEQITLVDPRETENTKPLEEVAPISIHPDYPNRHVMISTELIDKLHSTLMDFLKGNFDIFAWSQGDVQALALKILRKNQTFQWNEESETSFQQLKKYLSSPPLLTVPTTGEELFAYLSILPTAYEAFLAGLRVAAELGVDSLDVFSDFQLVVNQVQGDYLAKDTRMVAYLDEVKAMSGQIRDFKIRQIPREENKKANTLSNLATAFDFILDRNIPLEYLAHPSIEVAKLVHQADTRLTWMDDIVAYL